MHATLALYLSKPVSFLETTRDLVIASLNAECDCIGKSILAYIVIDKSSIVLLIEAQKADLLLKKTTGQLFRFGNHLSGTFALGSYCHTPILSISYQPTAFTTTTSFVAFVTAALRSAIIQPFAFKFAEIDSRHEFLSSCILIFESISDAKVAARVLLEQNSDQQQSSPSVVGPVTWRYTVEHLTVGKLTMFKALWSSHKTSFQPQSHSALTARSVVTTADDCCNFGIFQTQEILKSQGSSLVQKLQETEQFRLVNNEERICEICFVILMLTHFFLPSIGWGVHLCLPPHMMKNSKIRHSRPHFTLCL